MRKQLVFFAALLLSGTTLACYNMRDEDDKFNKSLKAGVGGGGGTGGTGSTTTSTTDTTPEPGCIPNMGDTPVGDDCGVFVSASKGDDATGDGSKANPVATPSKAIELAAGAKPIYLCAEAFAGPFELAGSALIYGGLDCANEWKYVGATTLTEISAGADQIPLRIKADVVVELQDVKVSAADATIKGGSSIGILVETAASLSLVRAEVAAGNGVVGASGAPYGSGAADGKKGADGGEACSAEVVVAPDPPESGCGAPDSVGGSGGVAQSGVGAAGTAGAPLDFANGGQGDDLSQQCEFGTIGANGASGVAGVGAPPGIGTLDPQLGYVGVSGMDGTAGAPGQGGGGGGASRGGTGAGKCPSAASDGGASGGNGGSGGCGGLGGKAGAFGGSSMAIVSFGAGLNFDGVKLLAKDGGAGGSGAQGQSGGLAAGGGAGGKVPVGLNMLVPGCAGGAGGPGGQGGRGGGGLGGHSIAIAHKGTTITGTPDVTLGAAGMGGAGDGPEGTGAAGTAEDVQEF